MNNAKVLVVLEPAESGLGTANARVLGAVTALRQHLPLECDLVLCTNSPMQIDAAVAMPDVAQVMWPDSLPDVQAETLAPWLASLASSYGYVFIASNSFGKNLLPRLAALLDNQPITDVTAIDSPHRFQRPIYAGSAIASVYTEQTQKLLGIRTSAFNAVAPGRGTARKVVVPGPAGQCQSRLVSEETVALERPELTAARVVVAGGRGLLNRDNFNLLYRLADKLGAAVGASRAAVDAGFVANDMQVGQTGKVIAPELYIAVGISGAVQHLAGMSESRVVVAINKDPDAPIFDVADYGLVADLFDVLPELITQL
ncbi:FAD-binding protein [Cellvibrio mixtus]|uniref:FAD-binding protein n=1 Tax=Cellvibrio mixtus TaxID=39650 RepID=UPI0006937D30|nr:FAD-binding protein [Cellvibrio mixtus]